MKNNDKPSFITTALINISVALTVFVVGFAVFWLIFFLAAFGCGVIKHAIQTGEKARSALFGSELDSRP